jgi:excisionase family DNA binding protein
MNRSLLTPDGAANMLGISSGEVRRLVAIGALPHVTLPGGQVRFDPDELAGWCHTLRGPVDKLVPSNRIVTDLEHR